MRAAFTDIVENQRLRERLRDDIAASSLSHAYILEGAEGTGKHTVAMRIAAALACQNKNDPAHALPCMECPSCKKILAGNSPDVITVNRGDKATLGVEAVRELKTDVYIPPNDLTKKIYIIEEAHLMTVQAQNALLLTLEEPPSYVLFLLLCENAATLLETVRSRAPTLHTEPISPKQIERYLRQNIPETEKFARENPQQLAELITASAGSIGRARALLDSKRHVPILESRKRTREFIRLCSSKRNSAQTLRFLAGLSQKRDELTEQCNEILLCLRDLLLCKQTEHAPLCFFSDREEACTLAYGFTTPELLALCDGITDTIERLRYNANVRLTMTAFAVRCGLLQ